MKPTFAVSARLTGGAGVTRRNRPDLIWVLTAVVVLLTLGLQLGEPHRPALSPQQAGIMVQ
jgi:hypothetical protein